MLIYATSPRQGTANYNIALDTTTLTSTSFTLVATRTGSMASDACGDLTYDNLNVKGLKNQASGQTVATCWR